MSWQEALMRWEAFEKATLKNGLVLPKANSDPTLTVYVLELGLDSTLFVKYDPFILAEIVLLGNELAVDDEKNYGLDILNLWGGEEYIITPFKSGRNNCPDYVHWGYSWDCLLPKIVFHTWILEELAAIPQTPEQNDIVKRLVSFIKEMRQKGLLEWPVPDTEE